METAMSKTPEFVPLVDTHAHIFRRDLRFTTGSPSDFSRDYTASDYLKELDAAGVRYGAIAAASFLGTQHEFTLNALRESARLRGTVIVDPDISLDRLREMDQAGVVGIRIATGNMVYPPDLSSPSYKRLLSKVIDLDWHVHVYGRREHMSALIKALDAYGVKIVVDHFGARDNQSGENSEVFAVILAAVRKGRTWVKLSGPYLSEKLDHRAMAARLLAEGGPGRLLWGSDWPFVKIGGRLAYPQTVEWLRDWIPDAEVRRQIDANAIELYRFG
jgi:predicted TIM-barrel fold metal-dependent hydrolase